MENENSSAIIKETLYDKVFKPQKITLANGHIPFTGDDRL